MKEKPHQHQHPTQRKIAHIAQYEGCLHSNPYYLKLGDNFLPHLTHVICVRRFLESPSTITLLAGFL